jgi:hypothetical protein
MTQTASLEPDTLALRTRTPVIVAAALAGAFLCPLVDELVLGQLVSGDAYRLGELCSLAAWAAVLGAVLAALVVHAGLRPARGAGHVIGFAALAGACHPVLLLGVAVLDELGRVGLDELGRWLLAPFVLLLVGSIVSVPAGLVFGAIFAAGVSPAHGALLAPSHESPAIGWRGGARLLVGASALAVLLALGLEGRYCQTIFYTILPTLGLRAAPGTDLAWTGLVVLPAPLVVLAALFFLRARAIERSLEHTARMLTADGHPTWTLLEAPDEAQALPLRERDRLGTKAICVRTEGLPYRARPTVLARLDPAT